MQPRVSSLNFHTVEEKVSNVARYLGAIFEETIISAPRNHNVDLGSGVDGHDGCHSSHVECLLVPPRVPQIFAIKFIDIDPNFRIWRGEA